MPVQRAEYQSRGRARAGPPSVHEKSRVRSVRVSTGAWPKVMLSKYSPRRPPTVTPDESCRRALESTGTTLRVTRPGPRAIDTIRRGSMRSRRASAMETARAPGAVYPPNRASSASAPMTATRASLRSSGSARRPLSRIGAVASRGARRSLRNSTMLARAASRARRRFAESPLALAAESEFTYGRSNSPSANLSRNTRATALSMVRGAIMPSANDFRKRRAWSTLLWKMTSRPASRASLVAVA